MTAMDGENEAPAKDMPVLEDSKDGENGGGDKAAVVRKSSGTSSPGTPEDKPVRPKNFKPLTADEEKLIRCSETGKIDEIRVLLKNKKLKVDCLDDSGTTPLEHACYKGNLELVELLLAAGANVNNNMQTQGYTPLMFAALAGKLDVVKTLLQHGARTSATNNIGKNAAQLSGFTNLHPVKLTYFIRSNPIMLEEAPKILRTMESIIEKEVKSREMNEIMAMKIHYYSEVLRHVRKMTTDGKSFDDIVKLFVRGRDSKGFPMYLEDFLRRSIRSFPYHQTPLHSTMVHAIAKANLGGASGSMGILEQSINGQHMPDRDAAPCDTCCDPAAKKKCSSCKMVSYCNEECQKMHWPVHKKECADLAVQFAHMEARKAEEAAVEAVREEEERKAEEARKALEAEATVAAEVAAEVDEGRLDNGAVVSVEDVGIGVRGEGQADDDGEESESAMLDATDETALLAGR
ncbi:Ankyrin repeat and MYND domain-containing protein 2 [Hypsibius exemplaris]|uniref:Ankyrin repeat and MYND domain-containing protein 2 n=1 Tax=Hypsibius exemplaris TaxID=2072580 RepID=A0A1W0WRZ8_HYPEX|nr:Ankyrin repeat and MYND domain-containing protein 2 [Hypsibius exemplaris]